MNLQEQLDAERTKSATLTTERDAAKAEAAKFDGIKSALGSDAALADERLWIRSGDWPNRVRRDPRFEHRESAHRR